LTAVLFAHDPEQAVFWAACLHAWVVPVQPPGVQTVLLPAGQTPRGSVPAGANEHLPFDAESAQYWHVPVHPVSQHTLSTQWGLPSVPFWQSASVVQVDPSGFFPHDVPLQKLPPEHSEFDVHDGQQTLASLHKYGAHVIVLPAVHVPLPSQVESDVTMFVPALQEPGWHTVPSAHLWQAPAPSQVPSRWQVLFASGPQLGWPAAGIEPAGADEQVPSLPLTLQALQESVQVVSQQ
jgi:hypothetical protein